MTGVDKIKGRILEEAQEQAKANIERANAEAAEILKSAEKEAGERKIKTLEKAKSEAAEAKKRLVAIAGLEARKEKLKVKQEVMEEVFTKALDRLCSLQDDIYRQTLADMIVKVAHGGSGEIILSQKDKSKVGSALIKDVNERLSGNGAQSGVTLSEKTADIRGGFIFKSGDVEINNSFEAILRMKRDELEGEVMKQLF